MWAQMAKKSAAPAPAKQAGASGDTAAAAAASSSSSSAAAAAAKKAAASLHFKTQGCQRCVGFHVEVKVQLMSTTPVKVLRGIVYAAHDGVLVLQEPSGIRLVNVRAIRTPPVIIKEADGSDGKRKITDLAILSEIDAGTSGALNEKFEIAKAKREQMLANRNTSASALAQAIFDDLQKTFKCSWDGVTICINNLGSLRIPPPYSVDVVTGNSQRAIERVRIVLQRHVESTPAGASAGAAAATDGPV